MAQTCKKHPRYQVLREPTSDCPTCNEIWDNKQAEELGMYYAVGMFVGIIIGGVVGLAYGLMWHGVLFQ